MERLEQKIDNNSKSFQQLNNRVFQLENNFQMFTRIEVHLQGVDLTTIHTECSDEDEVKVKTEVITKQTKAFKIQRISNLFC